MIFFLSFAMQDEDELTLFVEKINARSQRLSFPPPATAGGGLMTAPTSDAAASFADARDPLGFLFLPRNETSDFPFFSGKSPIRMHSTGLPFRLVVPSSFFLSPIPPSNGDVGPMVFFLPVLPDVFLILTVHKPFYFFPPRPKSIADGLTALPAPRRPPAASPS